MTHTPVVCQFRELSLQSNREQTAEAVCCNLYDAKECERSVTEQMQGQTGVTILRTPDPCRQVAIRSRHAAIKSLFDVRIKGRFTPQLRPRLVNRKGPEGQSCYIRPVRRRLQGSSDARSNALAFGYCAYPRPIQGVVAKQQLCSDSDSAEAERATGVCQLMIQNGNLSCMRIDTMPTCDNGQRDVVRSRHATRRLSLSSRPFRTISVSLLRFFAMTIEAFQMLRPRRTFARNVWVGLTSLAGSVAGSVCSYDRTSVTLTAHHFCLRMVVGQ